MPVGINLSKKPRNASGSPMSSVFTSLKISLKKYGNIFININVFINGTILIFITWLNYRNLSMVKIY